MRTGGVIFAVLAGFFAVVATVYGVLSREPVGTTALALCGLLALLVGYYALFVDKRIDPQPEDNPAAEIAEGAGEYGFYSPHSWWPLAVAFSAAMAGAGFAFGWWLTALGAVFLLATTVGLVFEYYRGYHAEG
ncbi:MAG: cytochrome c oxidase subunit 4 [Actinomycetia bacterium]|jgi:xanthosine utilization system XapX-like protein|nr:cytochrome c oxidase subunit 4 [Actinomycetes bacterium]